jgi:hypothetical protein
MSRHAPITAVATFVATFALIALCATPAAAQTTQGTLPADETWTGPVTLIGDLTIPAGRTLTIAAGAQVRFASGDTMGSGNNTSEIELIVEGTLKIAGSAASPASLAPATGGTLHSIRVLAGGTANISHADIRGARQPLSNQGTLTVDDSVFADHQRGAISLTGGQATIKTTQLIGNCTGYSSTYALNIASGTNTLDHSTIAYNSCYYGVYWSTSATITNNIVVDNSTYGIYSTSQRTAQNNLVWRHSTNLRYTTNQDGVKYNPLFVSKTNLRITSLSPARKVATDGSDLGALAYVADTTKTLQGRITDPMTLAAGTHQVVGDLVVAKGTTLTLSPGARLQFAGTDGMEGGRNASETELVIEGTLKATGTASQLIVFEGTANVSWYGPRVDTGAQAQLAFVELTDMQQPFENRGTLTLEDAALSGNDRGALSLIGGSATVQRARLFDNCKGYSSTYAVNITAGSGSFNHNTIADNACYYAIYLATTFTVADNIISDNSTYGIYSTSQRTVQNNLIWRHSTNLRYTTNQNGVKYNPLFVSKSNLRITSYSPARKAGRLGDDIGALPYIADKTPALNGKLSEDLVLAAGTHAVVGDLWVASGVTLTLAPGATLQLAETDAMEGGNNSSEAELIVEGALQAVGSASSPITIRGAGTGKTFYGLRLLAGSSTTLSFAELSGAQQPIVSAGTLELAHSRVEGYDRGAISLTGGSANVHHTLFVDNCKGYSSTYAVNITGSGSRVFDHNTVVDNACYYGIYLAVAATVSNNIVVDNSTYGIYSTSQRTVQNNLVWQHSTNLRYTTNQNGISANPLFVAAGDYHLQASSPARGKALDGSDLGAFPYQVGAVDRIEISPGPSVTLAVKGTQAFSAQAYDAANNPIPSATISWSATAGAGSISSDGLFTAGCSAGSYTGAIKAQSGAVSASVSVVLQPGSLASIAVTPGSVTLAAKATQLFSAVGQDSCGNTLSSTPSISWSVAQSAAGSVDPVSGLFTAGCALGSYTDAIVASAGAVQGKASVTVQAGVLAQLTISPQNPTVAVGGQQSFSAQGADSCGNAVGASPSWSVIAGGGSIDAAGLFTAGSSAGSFTDTILAKSGAVEAKTSVTITAGTVAKVEVSPNPATVQVGQSVTFSAKAFDAAGNPVSATFAWSASNGTINTSGAFTAGTVAGSFTDSVTATAEGVSGKASLTIAAGPAAKVAVTPATITIAPGGQSSFTAKVEDSYGNVRADTVSWSVSPQAAGSVDASGNFTAGSAVGVYPDAVTASVGGVSGKASVTIAADALHHLELTPKSVTLSPTATTVFSVQGFDAQNNPVSITPTWSVVASGGTINNQGVFAAGTKAGTYADTVQVSAEGISAKATVVVEAGQLNRLVLDPTSAALDAGATKQFTVAGLDAWGNEVDVSKASWSADTDAGSIDTSGLFTAGTRGGSWPRGVTVTLDGIEAHAAITVKAEEPAPAPSDGGCAVFGAADEAPLSALVILLLVGLALTRRRRR